VGENTLVGMLVPNLFLRVPVEAAVRAAEFHAVVLAHAGQAVSSRCRIVIVDLEALGDDPADAVRSLVAAAKVVLAFGPHVQGELLAAARAAGAVALPRSAFLERLPELLRVASSTTGDG
jgi:hypothetical protein